MSFVWWRKIRHPKLMTGAPEPPIMGVHNPLEGVRCPGPNAAPAGPVVTGEEQP